MGFLLSPASHVLPLRARELLLPQRGTFAALIKTHTFTGDTRRPTHRSTEPGFDRGRLQRTSPSPRLRTLTPMSPPAAGSSSGFEQDALLCCSLSVHVAP